MQSPAYPTLTEAGHNRPALSVSELSQLLKRTVEGEFDHVRVRGEISGFKRHGGSGHCYFAMKDADAVLDAVCWRNTAIRLAMQPADGMEVIATGRLTTYPQRSRYQIVVDTIELAGEGALLKLLEERKRKLAAEGLFEPARKKQIPYLPEVIGVVTSPTGAVIKDILHRLADRFPRRVLLWPVPVQGEGAAERIAAAIRGFNALAPGGPVPRPNLLIVARGGGSLEDLWPFNEEAVVRAAADSAIPLISGVGHETDTTLIDFAADRRAPTPTAAAEMAVPVRMDLLTHTLECARRLSGGIARLLQEQRLHLRALGGELPDLESLLGHAQQRLDDWSERLANCLAALFRNRAHDVARAGARLRRDALDRAIERGRERLDELGARLPAAAKRLVEKSERRFEAQAQLLRAASYERVLERGFVLVRDSLGTPVTSVAGARAGIEVVLQFRDGEAGARVGARRPPKNAKKDDQGRLL
jgi:exodeoxyribonuclease VII large subunit